MAYSYQPIEIIAGVQPSTDNTNQATVHYVASDKVRFVDGLPEKIGGWDTLDPTGNTPILGTPRNIYSFILTNIIRYLLATNTSLYSLVGQQLINITPVITSGTALTNPFATYYGTLVNNPLTTTNGTGTIVVTDAAHRLQVGDAVKLSGATTTNGISSTLINVIQTVTAITTNTWTFTTAGVANASSAGGGASVVRATMIVGVTQAAHGYSNGWNVQYTGVVEVGGIGGIATSFFNSFFQIRNVATNSYDIILPAFATSSASSKGGTPNVYPQIPIGLVSATTGAGYGMGLYGAGLYGTALPGYVATPPRIWSFDRFGAYVVLTPGDQLGLYYWTGSISTLPVLVTNAPTAINYTFVSDNICTVLGPGGSGNTIQWSDIGNLTVWAPDSTNQAGSIQIQASDDFISHTPIEAANILHTKTRCYIYRYINLPNVYQITFLDNKGLIARNARISVAGIAIWMGPKNFYMYAGGNVKIIPANSNPETTLKKYIFNNLNPAQLDKIFCWYNEKFNEVWFHYPTGSNVECDSVARVNLNDFTWSPDTMQRCAGEYPIPLQQLPYLMDEDTNILRHENGYNDSGEALTWTISTRYFLNGNFQTELGAIIPDNICNTGDMTITFNHKPYAQSIPVVDAHSPMTIDGTTTRLQFRTQSRYWQYTLSGSALNQFWRAGEYQQEVQKGTPR